MKTCFVLMILSGLGVAGVLGRANLTERCKRVYDELPPSAFVTDIQANYRLTYPSSSVYTIKQSIRQSSDTMDGRAFIEVIQEVQLDDDTALGISRDKYIWNRGVYGDHTFVRELHYISTHGDLSQETRICTANASESNPFFEILLGIYDISIYDVPAVTTMLHFDQDKEYHCNRAYEVVGISTLEFTKNFTHPTYGNYDIKYYWTDPDYEWAFTDLGGVSVPVAMAANGTWLDPNGDSIQVEVFFDYHNFIATAAPLEEYLTEKDVTCTNRTDAKQLNFEMPTSFSFTSEFVSYLSNTTRDIIMLQPRQEWYSYEMNMSKVLSKNQFSHHQEKDFYVSEISDFSQGVLYIVDLRFDNCSFLPLAFLPDGPVHHLPDGRVIMPSAFDYFKLEKDFSYNGQFMERGSKMDFYVTANIPTSFGPLMGNLSTVLGVSSDGMALIQVDGSAVKIKPTFLEYYFTSQYNDPRRVLRQNIFNFDGTILDMKIFETKTCFADNEVSDKEIRLPIFFPTIQNNAQTVELRNALLEGIAKAGKVNSNRIQDMDMEYNKDEGKLYVVFTLVDYPASHFTKDELDVIGYDSLPADVKRNLSQVIDNIGHAVTDGSLLVTLADPLGNGTMLNYTADPDYYVTVTGRNSAHSYVPKNVDKGYSPGAMVGLAIVSVLIGMGLVVGAFWVSTWKRLRVGKNKTIPLRSVENPMTFTEMK